MHGSWGDLSRVTALMFHCEVFCADTDLSKHKFFDCLLAQVKKWCKPHYAHTRSLGKNCPLAAALSSRLARESRVAAEGATPVPACCALNVCKIRWLSDVKQTGCFRAALCTAAAVPQSVTALGVSRSVPDLGAR